MSVVKVDVSVSTLVGLAVMDAIDAGASVCVFLHDMPDPVRERLLGQLQDRGLTRDDNASNRDCRAVVGRVAVHTFPVFV